MNRVYRLIAFMLAILMLTSVVSGCGKKDTTPSVENQETNATTESTSPEVTISPELQKALEEGWLVEDWTEEVTDATESEETEPEETEAKETNPTETIPEETTAQVTVTAYEWYLSLSAEEQQAYFETFESIDAYFLWLNNAKAEFEEKQNATEIEGGSIDVGAPSN